MRTITQLVKEVEDHYIVCPAGPLKNCAAWRELKVLLGEDGSGPSFYQVEDGWIETFVGEQFHFANPVPGEVHLSDVAHALSQQCRYNGHTVGFLSVAEHSVHIARHVLERTGHRPTARAALLHDGAETYIGDLPRPIKHSLPVFRQLEEGIDMAVAERFDFQYPFPDIIKECDSRILRDERVQCMNVSGHSWGVDSLEPLHVTIEGWGPEEAERRFLEAYGELQDD